MKKVLIAEDEILSAKILSAIVNKQGYKVVDIIKNGDYVLESFKKHKPDLLLMDILLQVKSDGISAVEEIRKFSDVPVIYITSFSDKPTKHRAKKTYPVEYLTKPVDSTELVKIMKHIIFLFPFSLEANFPEIKTKPSQFRMPPVGSSAWARTASTKWDFPNIHSPLLI